MTLDVPVPLGERSYAVSIRTGPTTFAEWLERLRPEGGRLFAVSDANTAALAESLCHALDWSRWKVRRCAVPAGESSKSLEQLGKLFDAMAGWPCDRKTLVLAVGGGVVGDLAGFAAASFNRGLPLVMVPTTLLAMVDSSVGGKTGINHALGKNLIGAFHQPAGVWIDPDLLGTLPDREYRSGLAEIVKYGVIASPELFAWLEGNISTLLARDPAAVAHVVAESCRIKADVVSKDEREETGLRATLNYGHTFAHAFEAVGGYGAWLHGEAVSAGMVCAVRLAELRHGLDPAIGRRQREMLGTFGLPLAIPPEWDEGAMLTAMGRDKKAIDGALRFVLPTRMGEVRTFDDVPHAMVRRVLNEIRRN